MSELPVPAPTVSPEGADYWAATAEGRLALQRCTGCSHVIWYPRGFCPACEGRELEVITATGRGTIYSFTVIRRGAIGPYKGTEPYALAYVELEEGSRVMTNVVECDVDALQIGDAVTAVFHPTGEGTSLVRFRPS
jgi:uncharacterized OB-fold protein